MAAWKKLNRMAGCLAAAIFLLGGCGVQLETGYQYRPLNASATQRRAYYAPAFTPEKSAADQEKKGDKAPALGPSHQ